MGTLIRLTQRMTAAQLRLLLVLALELISDAVEQLHVALVRVLLQAGDEGPGHGTCGFATDGSVGTTIVVNKAYLETKEQVSLTKSAYPSNHST
jgi:hypothetical protein